MVAPPTIPIEQRFAEKYRVDSESGCWVWTASIRTNGYSQFRYSKAKNGYGHVFAYEHFVGSIPEGSQLHHTCENKACVNPDHLVAVSPREHIVELTDGPAARNAEKTHCKRGHPLSGENLHISTTGRRSCRACEALWKEEHRSERADYAREYHQKRYRDDPAFREAHQRRSREAMQRKRAEARKQRPPS